MDGNANNVSFLSAVCDKLLELHPWEDFSAVELIVPSKRAGIFIKQHWAEKVQRTTWIPKINTIDDFFARHCPHVILDSTSLLFELYAVYEQIEEQPDSFDDFLKWGKILLSDFNEIDRYLIPRADFFKNLRDIKALDQWSLTEEDLSEMQERYIAFWDKLAAYYEGLNEHLVAQGQTYAGAAYRYVAENFDQSLPEDLPLNTHFIGFNALSKAEENCIQALLKSNKACVHFDTDAYYLNHGLQEAGMFQRRYKKNWPTKHVYWYNGRLTSEYKQIEIVGIPGQVGQTKLAGHYLEEDLKEIEPEKYALVLGDESLLLPMLHAIPEQTKACNITMGFPLHNTPIKSLFQHYFDLHKRYGSFKGKFYHKDLLNFIRHPYVHLCTQTDKRPLGDLLFDELKAKNKSFLTQKELNHFLEEQDQTELQFLFQPHGKHVKSILDALMHLCEKLKDKFMLHPEAYTFEKEYTFQCMQILNKTRVLLDKYHQVKSALALKRILDQFMHEQKIDFFGEPLKGIQIMGMLETRTLDFDHVQMLAVNEDVLPKRKHNNSFIPFDLKAYFQLPTHQERDAIYAYYFYRLLQRSKSIRLIYNTQTDEFGNGEQSRFITQLVHELPKINPRIKLTQKLASLEPHLQQGNNREVQKNPRILDAIQTWAEQGISPSALNTYKQSSLEFYYQYVLGLQEENEIEETIGIASLGTFVHNTLEKLYLPYLNQPINQLILKEIQTRSEEVLTAEFSQHYKQNELFYGKNYLIFNVARNFVNNFIQQEQVQLLKHKQIKTVQSLEQELRYSMKTKLNGQDRILNFKGKADRIDRVDGKVQIIDYKTGMVKPADIALKSLEDILSPKKEKAFQVLLYAYLYWKEQPETSPLTSGIISLRNLKQGFMPVTINKNEVLDATVMEEFESILLELLHEIYNDQVPFIQNKDYKFALYSI